MCPDLVAQTIITLPLRPGSSGKGMGMGMRLMEIPDSNPRTEYYNDVMESE